MVSPDSPIAAAIREALAGRSDVVLALLFGSQARGRARPSSDVDVAFSGAGVDPLALATRLTAAVGREVHLLRLEDASVPMLMQLVRDSIVVHEGVRGAAPRWRARALLTLELDGPWYARMRDAWLARVAERGL